MRAKKEQELGLEIDENFYQHINEVTGECFRLTTSINLVFNYMDEMLRMLIMYIDKNLEYAVTVQSLHLKIYTFTTFQKCKEDNKKILSSRKPQYSEALQTQGP